MADNTEGLKRNNLDHNICVELDIEIYRRLSSMLTVPPTPFLLLHMGPEGNELFNRRAVDAATWQNFRLAVTKKYPEIPQWTTAVASDVILAARTEGDKAH